METSIFDLVHHKGRKIAVISLLFDSPEAVNDYSINAGRIGLYNGSRKKPAPPRHLYVESKALLDARTAALRLRWNDSPNAVYYYNVYQRNPDGGRTTSEVLPTTPTSCRK